MFVSRITETHSTFNFIIFGVNVFSLKNKVLKTLLQKQVFKT